jgi:hypothetical protein
MGAPPAPPYATLYFAIHKEIFLDKFGTDLIFYKRFIDGCIGIWTPLADPTADAARWQAFQDQMNAIPGLAWEFTLRGPTLDFMDLILSIRADRIYTTVFEKALNLYLYIPPHSAHPPGVLSGLILGMIFRIYSLCTDPADAHMKVKTFYNRVLARGYKPTAIRPLFQKAYIKLRDKANQTVTTKTDLTNTILFSSTVSSQ